MKASEVTGLDTSFAAFFSGFSPVKSVQPIGRYVPFWSSWPYLEINYRSRYETGGVNGTLGARDLKLVFKISSAL